MVVVRDSVCKFTVCVVCRLVWSFVHGFGGWEGIACLGVPPVPICIQSADSHVHALKPCVSTNSGINKKLTSRKEVRSDIQRLGE